MNTGTRRYLYAKKHRLQHALQFDAVYAAKTRESRGPLTCFAIPNDLGHPRLGLSVGRKIGTAPKRNRIKRLLRESFRLMQHDLPRGYDLVLVVRPHETLLLADYQKLLTHLTLKAHQMWSRAPKPAADSGGAVGGGPPP